MGRAEQVAKLEALLERIQQRAALPRAHESGAVSVRGVDVAAVRLDATLATPAPVVVAAPVVETAPVAERVVEETPSTRRRPAAGISPPERLTPPPRLTPFQTPSPRRVPIAASPLPRASSVEDVARPRPSAPELRPSAPEIRPSVPGAAASPVWPRVAAPSAPGEVLEPITAVAVSPDTSVSMPVSPREALLTPTAQLLTSSAAAISASEKPRVRVNPEMTAPVSAEEVAAAAAAMNRVPTFPDSWPVEASAKSAVARAHDPVFPLSGPKFGVAAGTPGQGKDVYLEDGEEPTKPLAHPPRTAPPKSAQQLEVETAGAAPFEGGIARPATIPFDAYPARPGAGRDVAPGSDPTSAPRAMVVPREVETPAFLSNLRAEKEKSASRWFWLFFIVIVVAGAVALYQYGYLEPLLDKMK